MVTNPEATPVDNKVHCKNRMAQGLQVLYQCIHSCISCIQSTFKVGLAKCISGCDYQWLV